MSCIDPKEVAELLRLADLSRENGLDDGELRRFAQLQAELSSPLARLCAAAGKKLKNGRWIFDVEESEDDVKCIACRKYQDDGCAPDCWAAALVAIAKGDADAR